MGKRNGRMTNSFFSSFSPLRKHTLHPVSFSLSFASTLFLFLCVKFTTILWIIVKYVHFTFHSFFSLIIVFVVVMIIIIITINIIILIILVAEASFPLHKIQFFFFILFNILECFQMERNGRKITLKRHKMLSLLRMFVQKKNR